MQAEAAIRRVRALIELGRAPIALVEARKGLEAQPEDAELLELHGLCLVLTGDLPGALGVLQAAQARAPQRAHVHYLVGYTRRQQEDLGAAEACYREAVRLEPGEPVYLRVLAELLAEQRHLDEALALARKAVALGPERSTNHITLGFVASAGGDLGLAHHEYALAVELEPTDATAWNNLGCIEMARGERLKAREHFREALRLEPTSSRSQRNLAKVRPAQRPLAIYQEWSAFLGEVVRDLLDAGRAGSPLRLLALGQAVGRQAVQRAMTSRMAEGSVASKVGVAALSTVAAAALNSLGPGTLVPVGIAAAVMGVGWLATNHKVTPLRRRLVGLITPVRTEWEESRKAWLEGRIGRAARESSVERLLERLAVAIDAEPTDDEQRG